MLTHSFEELAQSFRILGESKIRLVELMEIDRLEAIGTLETSIDAMLNAFHKLHDLMVQKGLSRVDWYSNPELCTMLAIRNGRYENRANRIRTIYNAHNQKSDPTHVQSYFYVDFPFPPGKRRADCFDVEISWGDVDTLLNLPGAESKLGDGAKELIREYLNADGFEDVACKNGFKKGDIFINFVPLALKAGITLYPEVNGYVSPGSIESKYFLQHFTVTGAPMTRSHEYTVLDFSLPE